MSYIHPAMSILSDDQKALLYEKALWILKNVGVKIECPEVFGLFAKKIGIKCEGEVVKIPGELVKTCLDQVARNVDIYNRRGEKAFSLGPDTNDETRFSIGSPQLNYQDPLTREIEQWERRHTGLIAGLANTLDTFDAIATPGTIHDYGPKEADYYSTLEMLANTEKPILILVSNDSEFPGILKFINALFPQLTEKPFVVPYLNIITPLVLNKGTTDKMRKAFEYGLPVIFNNYIMAGATAPVLPAGYMALILAELLSGIVCSQLIKEGSGIICGSLPTAFNMSSMTAAYSSVSTLISHSVAEMMAYFGVPHSGTSGNSIGWEGDLLQAGIIWINNLGSLMGKVGLCPFSGPVFQATTLSPTAILLADEIICEARKYARGVKLEDDFLLDEIKEVGPGGSYFGTRTTFERFKEFQPDSKIWPDMTLAKWQEYGMPTANQILREKTNQMLGQLAKPFDCKKILEKGESYIKSFG